MRNLLALLLLPALAGAAPASPLPLAKGNYVQSNASCKDPAFAVMRSYDGIGLGDPHSHACRARVLARHGRHYAVANSCINAGVGPAPRSTERLDLTVLSHRSFAVGDTPYRLCPGLR